MDQLRINGYQPIGRPVLKFQAWRKGTSVCEHRLELSTGVVVGFCYHKAADLRVRQAAHSLPCLSCIRSCSDCCLQQLFARDHRSAFLTALHGVWSLTQTSSSSMNSTWLTESVCPVRVPALRTPAWTCAGRRRLGSLCCAGV